MGNRIFTSDIEITGDLNVSGTITGGGSGPSANPLTKITWQALKTKRDEGNLIPGMKYQITDYMTTTSQKDTRSVGHQFDIIVEALSKSELSENAKAISHEGNDYFKTSREYVESAEWVSPMPSIEDIEILYNLQDDNADADYVHESAKVITQLTTHLSEDGIEVPAMFNPDPEASHYVNNLITVYYTINDDGEVVYEGRLNSGKDLIVDYQDDDPVDLRLFKTDLRDYSIDEVDYQDYYRYWDRFQFNGVLYDRWRKYAYNDATSEVEATSYYILTNIIVENEKFTFTREQFNAAIQYVQEPSDYDCYYIYAGTYSMSQTVNTLVSEQYTMYEDDDEVIYGPGQYHPEDIFVKIGYTDVDGVNTPVMYKTDYDDPDLIEEGPDYGDPFLYQGDFELNGVTYNMWLKQLQGYRILTQVIVVNNQFTITQEQLEAAIQTTTIAYDKWQEYTAALGYNDTIYHLTNHFVDATMGTKVDDPVRSWQLKYCLDNDSRRFGWADASIGKGIVYYLKDDLENECPYDFKNIQFYVNTKAIENALYPNNEQLVDNQWLYTFAAYYYDDSYEDWRWDKDATVWSKIDKAYCNKIKPMDGYRLLPINVVWTESNLTSNINIEDNCTDNYLGACHNITLGGSCTGSRMKNAHHNIVNGNCYNVYCGDASGNSFGLECRQVLINGGHNNKFDKYCQNITLTYSGGNTFGHGCTHINFTSGSDNILGDNCSDIVLNNCSQNIFSGGNSHISLGDNCRYNSFSLGAADITFGENCQSNTTEGAYIGYITLSGWCINNKFSHSFYITLGNNSGSNIFEDCHTITLDVSNNQNYFKRCDEITMTGTEVDQNTFTNVSHATIGERCSNSSFFNCTSIGIGNNCYRNVFHNLVDVFLSSGHDMGLQSQFVQCSFDNMKHAFINKEYENEPAMNVNFHGPIEGEWQGDDDYSQFKYITIPNRISDGLDYYPAVSRELFID